MVSRPAWHFLYCLCYYEYVLKVCAIIFLKSMHIENPILALYLIALDEQVVSTKIRESIA